MGAPGAPPAGPAAADTAALRRGLEAVRAELLELRAALTGDPPSAPAACEAAGREDDERGSGLGRGRPAVLVPDDVDDLARRAAALRGPAPAVPAGTPDDIEAAMARLRERAGPPPPDPDGHA